MWPPDNDFDKYNIPDRPKLPTGLAREALFEQIDPNLYKPKAHMVAFRIDDKERLLFWIKTLAYRYHSQLGGLKNFICNWVDKTAPNDDENIEEIFIQILKGTDDETVIDSNKLLTFHIYPTTYLITIQGTHYLSWCNAEFQYLKSIVDYHFNNDMNVTIPSDQNSYIVC